MAKTFVREQWVAAELERVFGFFADPGNLPLLSPPQSGVRLVSAKLVPPGRAAGDERRAGTGSEVVISVRLVAWLPFRVRWTALITDFQPNRYFQDELTSGPFRFWKHRHEFERCSRDGREGTLIRDRVSYRIGLGPLEGLVDRRFVGRILDQSFAFRHAAAERLLSRQDPSGETLATR